MLFLWVGNNHKRQDKKPVGPLWIKKKTFLVGLCCIIRMNLFPYSEIVITASTISQANKICEDKIRDEIIKKLSPYLLYMYDNEYLVITHPDDGYKIENKLNGSILRILPSMESSRGSRATMLVYEEARLLKSSMVTSVFEKMAHPRQAKYLSNPKYATQRWREECQHIYITSARFQFEWFWRVFKNVFTRHFTDRHVVSNIFAGDIFTAIDNGLKSWADYWNAKNDNEMDFRMEDLNEMVSENEDSFFTYKSFKTNQIIKEGFDPPNSIDVYIGLEKERFAKKDSEVRIVAVDYAFANTTSNKKNDNTIILCMSLHWKKNYYERHVDYIQAWEASDSIGAMRRVRELYFDYNADYVVTDQRSGGETIFNAFTEPWVHPVRGKNWNPHGFTVVNKPMYQIVTNEKMNDLKARTVDKEAIECIIPFIGSSSANSVAWVELKKNLEYNRIKFLVTMDDREHELIESGKYFELPTEELAEVMLPYAQTDLLVQEAINLKTEFKGDNIKLVEPTTGTKDRIVILSYANYIASLIENERNKQEEETELNWEDIQCVW